MGDYVDRFGKGRTFTPDQLKRTAHRLEQQPKGKPVRVFECRVCGKLRSVKPAVLLRYMRIFKKQREL